MVQSKLGTQFVRGTFKGTPSGIGIIVFTCTVCNASRYFLQSIGHGGMYACMLQLADIVLCSWSGGGYGMHNMQMHIVKGAYVCLYV